jgi:protocatechuate 3,4-dioxygenase beta subunit
VRLDHDNREAPLPTSSRRGFLAIASASAASLVKPRPSRAASDDRTAASLEDACILTPQSEDGPFYLDPKLVRADVTEGKPGVPLTLRFRLIEAGPCMALSHARIDIWHCDARGVYSAFTGQGERHNIDMTSKTFLRGTQMTNGAGWAEFATIYPGWYPGRATHIHFKVFVDDKTVLTGQTYFPDALNEFIYGNVPDYTGRPRQRATLNLNDYVVRRSDPSHRAFCAVKEERDRYVASLTIAVARGSDGAATTDFHPPPAEPIRDRLAALVPGLKRTP